MQAKNKQVFTDTAFQSTGHINYYEKPTRFTQIPAVITICNRTTIILKTAGQ